LVQHYVEEVAQRGHSRLKSQTERSPVPVERALAYV
jgi:hypothetical protein